ncbi:MAG: protein kinase [Gemmatimonadaceae bacterium]|nr:protein kinase [Gemmatimonadaceae bacterium]
MDPLPKLRSSLADRYDIDKLIGTGGMATVYLARDVKHHRQVAIKLLNPELGAVLGPERFLAEIRVTANLQHPNLLPLFDSGEADGQLYYVMPFVEGESLRARLDREKQLSVNEAVRIGSAVASALDYAHRHGVVHRDLKPENILLHDGQPLVADFGIALAVSNAGGERVTQTGLSLGTPQYMSPEQATGERSIDARSDIYSLGAVIYEMLSGEPPHTGGTVQAIIARVVTDTPRDLRTGRPSIPDHVSDAVAKALEKVPADRFDNAREMGEALQGQRTVTSTAAVRRGRATVAASRSTRLPWIIAGVLALVAAASLAFAARARSGRLGRAEEMLVKFALDLPGDELPDAGFAVSPDGRTIVYSLRMQDSISLYARSLNDPTPRQITGTRSGILPFFSPDGKWLAFFAENKLRKIPLEGGTSIELLTVRGAVRGFWGEDDRIYLSRAAVTGGRVGLSSLPSSGGGLTTLTMSDSLRGVMHNQPRLLPDKKTLLFVSHGRGGTEDDFLAIGNVDGSFTVSEVLCSRLFGQVESHALCSDPNGLVTAVPLDLGAQKVAGPVISLESGVNGLAELSDYGHLVFNTSIRLYDLDFIKGGKTSPVLSERLEFRHPRISPSGNLLAVSLAWNTEPGNVGLVDLSDGRVTKLTIDGAENLEWSPDGTRLFFSKPTRRDGRLWWFEPDRTSSPQSVEPLLPPALAFTGSYTISPNGSDLIIGVGAGRNQDDLFMMSLSDPKKPPIPWMQTQFIESQPRFSPEGARVAYISNESSKYEVYVAPFPGPGSRAKISANGGWEPTWSQDGKRIFYRTDAGLEVVEITAGPSVRIGVPRLLEKLPLTPGGVAANYAVTADGRVIAPQRIQSDTPLLMVYLNWLSEVRKKLGK